MTGLVEFLTARLDEDEAEALKHPDGEDSDLERWEILAAGEMHYPCSPYLRIAKARVLADVAAKRQIVEKITGWGHYYVQEDTWFSCGLADDGDGPGSGCADDDRRGTCDCRLEQRQNEYLALLALPHADHPDYDATWRP